MFLNHSGCLNASVCSSIYEFSRFTARALGNFHSDVVINPLSSVLLIIEGGFIMIISLIIFIKFICLLHKLYCNGTNAIYVLLSRRALHSSSDSLQSERSNFSWLLQFLSFCILRSREPPCYWSSFILFFYQASNRLQCVSMNIRFWKGSSLTATSF